MVAQRALQYHLAYLEAPLLRLAEKLERFVYGQLRWLPEGLHTLREWTARSFDEATAEQGTAAEHEIVGVAAWAASPRGVIPARVSTRCRAHPGMLPRRA